ncbi:MAG: hypothetical protein ACK48S_12065 [Planctomycetia bacterium]
MSFQGRPWRRRFAGLIAPIALAAAAAIALAVGPADPGHRRAVAFAASVCLIGTLGAWIVGQWPARTPWGRVAASLGATALRLFPALLALGWLQTGGSDLTVAGAGGMLVVFYLVALAADLVRTMMEASRTGRPTGKDEAI